MGSMLLRAIDEAGFGPTRARALSGDALSEPEIARLREADLLVLAGLADLVRKKFRGDEVRVLPRAGACDVELSVFEASDGTQVDPAGPPARTGAELLREIALARLRTPGRKALAVSLDELGVELAQTALVFGADVLFGDLGAERSLPLLDGPEARRAELKGLIERSGRSVVFGPSRPELEQRP